MLDVTLVARPEICLASPKNNDLACMQTKNNFMFFAVYELQPRHLNPV